MNTNQLCLGTLQLGQPYGIANTRGMPDKSTIRQIIAAAWDGGIREFDTAQGYAASERNLGIAFHDLGITDEVKVITKLDPSLDHNHPDQLSKALEESLEKLQLTKLYGLMLHRESFLDVLDEGLREILVSFKEMGLIEKIGISVYAPEYASAAANTDVVDMIQIPSNVFDRRFENIDLSDRAASAGKLLYIRSALLQGLVLLPSGGLSPNMMYARPHLDALKKITDSLHIDPIQLSYGYLKKVFPHARILTGAEHPDQIRANLSFWNGEISDEIVGQVQSTFSDVPINLLNPALWPTDA